MTVDSPQDGQSPLRMTRRLSPSSQARAPAPTGTTMSKPNIAKTTIASEPIGKTNMSKKLTLNSPM